MTKSKLLFILSTINLYLLNHYILAIVALILLIIHIFLDKQVTKLLNFPERDWHRRTYEQMKRDGYDEEEIYDYMGKELNKMKEQVDGDELFPAGHIPWWLDRLDNIFYLLCLIMLVVSVVLRVMSHM